MRRAVTILVGAGTLSCFAHSSTPTTLPKGALAGRAPSGFDAGHACVDWRAAASRTHDGHADEHDSFPELFPEQSCFVRVHDQPNGELTYDPPPPGCAHEPADTSATLLVEASRYEAIAHGQTSDLPNELACVLPDEVRRSVALANARTLRSLATRSDWTYPYAAVATFGYGSPHHGSSPLLPWRPGASCGALAKDDLDALGVNVLRAGRAAWAVGSGVAPVMIVSGGAIHSPLYEALMMGWIATCRLRVPPDEILYDPCADHTHTNMRNTGRLVSALGGRAALVVTDDGLQSGYLEEWTFFDTIGGSLDQRALRDWHYLLGSWRRAGDSAEFWFSPYRFWADPRLRDLRCVH